MSTKVSHACLHCIHHKVKCDGESPCKRCVDRERECMYGTQAKRGRKVREDEARVRTSIEIVCDDPNAEDYLVAMLSQTSP